MYKICKNIFLVGSVIRCIVQNAGHLLSRASVTLPGIPIDLPEISEKDKSDLIFGVKNGVDAVFISGIKKEETIKRIREILGELLIMLYFFRNNL